MEPTNAIATISPVPKPDDGYSHRFKFKHGQEVILKDADLTGYILCRSDQGTHNLYRVFVTFEGGILDEFIPEYNLIEVKPKPVKKS